MMTIAQCTSNVEKRVTDNMNRDLLEPFTAEELKAALNQMAPFKSPGPDGYSACYYQSYWHMVGAKVYVQQY